MSLTPSSMLPLGTRAPAFELPDTLTNSVVSLADLHSHIGTVIMFICNHCPYVVHIRSQLVAVAEKYQAKGIQFIAINANDQVKYPQDGPDAMRVEAETHHYPFPYLFDESQAVAKAYQAACTPDFYLFDKDLLCVYRGRFDGATPGNKEPVTGIELTQAMDCLLDGKAINPEQKPSVGCNIKWKS